MDVFADCLKKGRLKQVEPDIEGAARELETCKGELERARQAYGQGRWEDVITQAYFAMHRCARAAINSRGYRDTNLYGLLAGIDKLFVEPGQLPQGTAKRISEAKDIKDSVYNGGRAGGREAKNMLILALELAKSVFGLLKLPGFDSEAIDTNLPERVDPQRGRPARSEDSPRAEGPPHGESYPRSTEGSLSRDRYPNGDYIRRPRSGPGGSSSWRSSGDDNPRWRSGNRAAR
ncbi:MAG: hypothetical protein V1774_06305 [Candidatus Eisenbacteria bacterium]